MLEESGSRRIISFLSCGRVAQLAIITGDALTHLKPFQTWGGTFTRSRLSSPMCISTRFPFVGLSGRSSYNTNFAIPTTALYIRVISRCKCQALIAPGLALEKINLAKFLKKRIVVAQHMINRPAFIGNNGKFLYFHVLYRAAFNSE